MQYDAFADHGDCSARHRAAMNRDPRAARPQISRMACRSCSIESVLRAGAEGSSPQWRRA
jgi:hypothetical protein